MSSVETMQTWPLVIREINEIPEIFLSSFKTILNERGEFPYTVFVPGEKLFFRSIKQKLISYSDGKLYILEALDNNIKVSSFSPDTVIYIEKCKVLLNSWIKICGICEDKILTIKIEYNSVGEKLLELIINKFRSLIDSSKDADLKNEKSKFNFLERQNYKLMYYSLDTILESMKINKVVFQKLIKTKKLKFLSKNLIEFVIILTDNELIVIKDGTSKFISRFRYGGIWQFIPLKKIKDITLSPYNNESNIELEIILDHNVSFRNIFDIENKNSINELIDIIKKKKE